MNANERYETPWDSARDLSARDFRGNFSERETTFAHEPKTALYHTVQRPKPGHIPVSGFHVYSNTETRLLNIAFRCAACKDTQYHYFVLARRGSAMKVGQLPRWSPIVERDLQKFFDNDLELFRKGRDTEAEGYGIGAYAYYRRVIENTIDLLLISVTEAATENERSRIETALAALSNSHTASDKIEVAAKLLPASLMAGGNNPLLLIHGALSVGIHSLTDEECLAHAQTIRIALTHLVATARHAKQSQAAFTEAIKKLDKIRKRPMKDPENTT